MLTVALAVGVAVAEITVAMPSQAETSDVVKARDLFKRGISQEAANDWAGALGSFEEVARLKNNANVAYHVARCKEKLGRWTEALGAYRLAEYEGQRDKATKADVLAEIQRAISELEPRMPKLVLVRGANADRLRFELDGVSIGATQLGAPIQVDPGPHHITAVGPDGSKEERAVELTEGATKTLSFDGKAPSAERPAAPPVSDAPPTARPVERPASAPAPARQASSGPGVAPWAIAGVGLASLVASGAFFGLRQSAKNELDATCVGSVCPESLRDTQSAGERWSLLTGVTLATGIVGVGVGTIWLIAASGSGEPTAAPQLALRLRGPSLTLEGTFR